MRKLKLCRYCECVTITIRTAMTDDSDLIRDLGIHVFTETNVTTVWQLALGASFGIFAIVGGWRYWRYELYHRLPLAEFALAEMYIFFGMATVTDNQGRQRTVRVPPDVDTLQEIAEMTDGAFFSAPSAEELTSVYEDLGSKIGYDTETTEITVGFAGVAALLVLAAGSLSLLWFNRFP